MYMRETGFEELSPFKYDNNKFNGFSKDEIIYMINLYFSIVSFFRFPW